MEKISQPGKYSGYSEPEYDGYKRFSVYVPMRDGVKLALDYYRPTLKGKLVEKPLPVIWHYTPYGRCLTANDGTIVPQVHYTSGLDKMHPEKALKDAHNNIMRACSHGYIFAMADVRGQSSSYGWTLCGNDPIEGRDGYDLNEWIAQQDWCNGKLAMIGFSYDGQTIIGTIREQPPHLVAAMIGKTDFNKYDAWMRGGISRSAGMSDLPVPPPGPKRPECNVPVDEDVDGSLLAAAKAQHQNFARAPIDRNNPPFLSYWTQSRIPFRDSWSPDSDSFYWESVSASPYKKQINDSGVAIYCFGGWFDIFSRSTVIMYNNIETPHKLIMGPWTHPFSKTGGLDTDAEAFRFFDYWLKGIENGVMDEPPIYYYTSNTPEGGSWEFAEHWPPKDTKLQTLFMRGEKSNTTRSLNDGTLSLEADETDSSKDDYISVYGIGDMEALAGQISTDDIDEKGLVFTSAPLQEDVCVTGHPIAELFVSSTSDDGDFFVSLTDADESGSGKRVSEGHLRMSMRSIAPAPYNFIGLPWHPCTEKSNQKVEPGKIVKLTIDLMPVSYVFKKGHRIRIEITNAMLGAFYYREPTPPIITLYRNCLHPSLIMLPVKYGSI